MFPSFHGIIHPTKRIQPAFVSQQSPISEKIFIHSGIQSSQKLSSPIDIQFRPILSGRPRCGATVDSHSVASLSTSMGLWLLGCPSPSNFIK
jgi:hypothetical protein